MTCPVAPIGDSCDNAIPLVDSLPLVVGGNTCGYTDQYFGTCSVNGGGPDVVYSYTPATDRLVHISLCRDVTNFDTVLYVYAGDCHSAPITCNDFFCTTASQPGDPVVSNIPELQLTGGVTYYIVVDGAYPFNCGDYELLVEDTEPCIVTCPPDSVPENEPCGDNTNGGCTSTVPVFEPLLCGETVCGTGWFDGNVRDTDWYEMDITSPATVTLTANAEFEVLLAQMQQLVSGEPGCINLTGDFARFDVQPRCTPATITTSCLQPGTYYFFVAPQFLIATNCPKHYTLTASCVPCSAPDNDHCEGALPVALGVPTLFDNRNATDDPGNCLPVNRVTQGVWYTIVGDGTTYTATTCSANTQVHDTLISLYTECGGSCVDGNDDSDCIYSNRLSTLLWCTTGGQIYHILVGSYLTADTGVIELTVTSDGAPCTLPPGETCANAIVVDALPFTGIGNTCGYLQNYDASCTDGPESRDVVYAYTPATDQTVHISLCNDPTDFNTVLFVYEDTCESVSEVACDNDTCRTAAFPFAPLVSDLPSVPLSAGHTYYIVVDGFERSTCGNYELTITPGINAMPDW